MPHLRVSTRHSRSHNVTTMIYRHLHGGVLRRRHPARRTSARLMLRAAAEAGAVLGPEACTWSYGAPTEAAAQSRGSPAKHLRFSSSPIDVAFEGPHSRARHAPCTASLLIEPRAKRRTAPPYSPGRAAKSKLPGYRADEGGKAWQVVRLRSSGGPRGRGSAGGPVPVIAAAAIVRAIWPRARRSGWPQIDSTES